MRVYRRALITGATSGIGAAFAAELPAETNLLLVGRDSAKLQDAATRLARPGRAVDTLATDLREPSGVAQVIARAEASEIDLLINNAGVGRFGPCLDQAVEDEHDTAMVNVVAVVDLTRALLPGMIARARQASSRAGLVILSSTAAFAPVPYFATYAATKAFDLHFAEALAEELRGAPVDVLAVCPGATRTAFADRAGMRAASVPGATDPRQVAHAALTALGRQTVVVTGRLSQATFGPFVLPRRLLTGALGFAMRLANDVRR